jgi:hypothetical protein
MTTDKLFIGSTPVLLTFFVVSLRFITKNAL